LEFITTIELGEANQQIIEKQTNNNFEYGKEYVGLVKTPYLNLMLDK